MASYYISFGAADLLADTPYCYFVEREKLFLSVLMILLSSLTCKTILMALNAFRKVNALNAFN